MNKTYADIRKVLVGLQSPAILGGGNMGAHQQYSAFSSVVPTGDVLLAAWADVWKNKMYPPPVFGRESTYDGCVKWKHRFDDELLEVDLYDGELLDGRMTVLRCTWTIAVNERLQELLVHAMIGRLSNIVYEMRKREVEDLERVARAQIRESLFARWPSSTSKE